MKKHLFLTASFEDGSSLLRGALGPSLCAAGGFFAEKLSAENEALRIALRPAAAVGGVEGYGAPPVLWECDGRLCKDNEVWRSLGERLLREALYYPYAVLVPLGGYEIVVPQYREALADLLSAELPIAGLLLPRKDAEALGKRLGLGERYLMLIDRLHEALREDADTLLLDPAVVGEQAARRILQEWAREYAF